MAKLPPLQTCPFNPSHQLEQGSRFQRHLIRCQRSHLHVTEVTCPFNHQHRIKAPEFQFHIANCADAAPAKMALMNVMSNVTNELKGAPALPILIEPQQNLSENWENEILDEPFRVQVRKDIRFINADILSGMKPAEKKAYVKRLGPAYEQENEEEDEDSKADTPVDTVVRQEKLKPLRLPRKNPDEMLQEIVIGRGRRRMDLVQPPPGFQTGRIAANIFGGVELAAGNQPSHDTKEDAVVHEQMQLFRMAGIGRGLLNYPNYAAAASSAVGIQDSSPVIDENIEDSPDDMN